MSTDLDLSSGDPMSAGDFSSNSRLCVNPADVFADGGDSGEGKCVGFFGSAADDDDDDEESSRDGASSDCNAMLGAEISCDGLNPSGGIKRASDVVFNPGRRRSSAARSLKSDMLVRIARHRMTIHHFTQPRCLATTRVTTSS